MKNIFAAFLFSLPLVMVSSAPVNSTDLQARTVVVVPRPVVHSCTCHGRHYADVYAVTSHSAPFYNNELLNLGHCPNPMQRWYLDNHDLDRAVYSGEQFCACITHQGAATPNGFTFCEGKRPCPTSKVCPRGAPSEKVISVPFNQMMIDAGGTVGKEDIKNTLRLLKSSKVPA